MHHNLQKLLCYTHAHGKQITPLSFQKFHMIYTADDEFQNNDQKFGNKTLTDI